MSEPINIPEPKGQIEYPTQSPEDLIKGLIPCSKKNQTRTEIHARTIH